MSSILEGGGKRFTDIHALHVLRHLAAVGELRVHVAEVDLDHE